MRNFNVMKESKCATCGGLFYYSSDWVYKKSDGHNRIRKYCSYSCMQGKEYKEKKEKAWNEAYKRRWNK